MILLGSIVNSAAILVCGAVGLFAGKLLSPRIQKAVTSALQPAGRNLRVPYCSIRNFIKLLIQLVAATTTAWIRFGGMNFGWGIR